MEVETSLSANAILPITTTSIASLPYLIHATDTHVCLVITPAPKRATAKVSPIAVTRTIL